MIFADTNVILTCLLYFFAVGRDGQAVLVQRHNREPVVALLDAAIASGDLAITDTVAEEMDDVVRSAIRSAAKAADATIYTLAEVVRDVMEKFGRPYIRFRVEDSDACVVKAGNVYAGACRDGRMQDAMEARGRIKKRRGKDASIPAPDKDKGDFMILSTAADWAERGYEVTLLTFDQDFVAFAIAIREKLGVDIVDCGRLGR